MVVSKSGKQVGVTLGIEADFQCITVFQNRTFDDAGMLHDERQGLFGAVDLAFGFCQIAPSGAFFVDENVAAEMFEPTAQVCFIGQIGFEIDKTVGNACVVEVLAGFFDAAAVGDAVNDRHFVYNPSCYVSRRCIVRLMAALVRLLSAVWLRLQVALFGLIVDFWRNNMRFLKSFVALASCGLLLTACGGGNHQASTDNFKDILQQYGQSHGVCLPLALNVSGPNAVARQATLGMDKIVFDTQSHDGSALNENAAKQMAILVEKGLYRQEASPSTQQAVFTITDKGLAQTQAGLNGPLFCIGKQQVNQVLYFTEPAANAQGLIVSQVVYESDVRLEDWAKQLLGRGDADWKNRLQTRRTEQAVMVKTNDGWRDARSLPQPDLAFPQ